MNESMVLGNITSHNIRIQRYTQTILNKEQELIQLIDNHTNMVLAEFVSIAPISIWINPGGFMNKEDYDKMQDYELKEI